MFCAHELIFVGTDGVGSRFHVLRSPARFRRRGGRRVPFSFFAPPDSFSAVPRASGLVWMFYAPGLIFVGDEGVGSRTRFGGVEGVESRFHVFRSRSRFPLSCLAVPNSFSAVPRASGPVFMFCALELVFGGSEGVGSRFHVLRAQTRFWRYRGRQIPNSCFALPDSFSRVTRALDPIFMFCAPGLIFDRS
jgi:hypothetical protein